MNIEPVSETEERIPEAGTLWCLVANVVAKRAYGPGGAEMRHGTRHFAPNARLYVVDFYWGMGAEQAKVIGRHRKSGRFVSMVIASNLLTNWRAKLIYEPAVLRRIAMHPVDYWTGLGQDREKIEKAAAFWNGMPSAIPRPLEAEANPADPL